MNNGHFPPESLSHSQRKPVSMRVVIVDSDEESRLRWKLALQASVNVTVVGEAGLVAEAISVVRHTQPHVVVLDPKIPDWNSLTIVRALKQWSPASIVVVATTTPTGESAAAFMEAGANYYFDKHREFHMATDAIATMSLSLQASESHSSR